MTNKQNRIIRFVKCPKCARILPEPEQVPLYTCGGCGTILQAKSYKSHKEDLVSTLRTEDVVQSKSNDLACDHIRVSSGSSRRSSSSIEQSAIQNEENSEKAVCSISRQIVAEDYALHTSLSEESSACEISTRRDFEVHENINLGNDSEISYQKVPGNEINCLAVSFGKEDVAEKEQNNFVEHVRQKFESVRFSSDSSTSINRDRNDNSLRKVVETTGQKIENFDDISFIESRLGRSTHKPETSELVHTHEEVGNLANGVSRSLTKRSIPYNEIFPSSNGNDNHVQDQSEHSSGENDISEHHRTWQHKNDHFPPATIPFHMRTGSSDSFVRDGAPYHCTHSHPYEKRRYMERKGISEATWRERDIPPMYCNDEPSREIYQKQRYYSGNLPQTRYTGEVYNERLHIHDRCMHPRHNDRRWSTQLTSVPRQAPPAGYYHHWPIPYADPSEENSWDQYEYDPYTKNPQRILSFSSYGRSHNTIYRSDGQWKKKQQAMIKRHLRPIAGGAPFVTCRFCFRVIQLPEEFILCKQRKKHRLKCGGCSIVLEFSLDNGTYLAPRVPHAGKCKGGVTNLEKNVSSLSSSQVNVENGRNFVSKEPPITVKELVKHKSSGALGGVKRQDEVASPSFQSRQVKVSWKRSSRSKSPLHRLMGYASPEDLLKVHTANV